MNMREKTIKEIWKWLSQEQELENIFQIIAIHKVFKWIGLKSRTETTKHNEKVKP